MSILADIVREFDYASRGIFKEIGAWGCLWVVVVFFIAVSAVLFDRIVSILGGF